jgi:hypothetical protein
LIEKNFEEMTVQHLALGLERALPSGFLVSRYPNHPYLFAGPDLLIGGEGKLCALFFAKRREISRVDGLLARLIASRLSLPEHMRCAVVIGQRHNDTERTDERHLPHDVDQIDEVDRHNADFEREIGWNFQEVFGSDQVTEIARWAEHSNTARGFNSVPREIRARAQLRYQVLFHLTALRLSHFYGEFDPMRLLGSIRDAVGKRPKTVIPDENSREDRQPSIRNVVREDFFSVGAASFKTGRSAQEKIRPLCIYSIQRAYTLDNGVPYPRKSDPNILLIDEKPSSTFDPFKAVRCANFAGWVLTSADDSQEITALAEHIRESYQRHKL